MTAMGFGVVRIVKPLLRVVDARAILRSSNLHHWAQVHKLASPSSLLLTSPSPFSLHRNSFAVFPTQLKSANTEIFQDSGTAAANKKKLQRKKRTIIDREDHDAPARPVNSSILKIYILFSVLNHIKQFTAMGCGCL